ncbi:MAG TPA: serine/threonine-protein kinase [Myxococcaceae bacterium]|jgi:serine/threonine protein kinase
MMAPVPPEARFPEYGSLVGCWRVQERIGSGSHGVVFRAVRTDKQDGKSYALKLAVQKDDARMEREIWLLSRLRHPSVPRLEGSGEWTSPRGDTYPYLVMEWVEGQELYKWAAEHGLTLRQAIRLLAQVARALEATHRYGVHRDVKGGNILVNAQGDAVLLDFGCCWYQGASPLTAGAVPPGTEPYRSPQLLFFRFALGLGTGGYYESQPADDVYALGVTAYRLLAGAYPPRPEDLEDQAEDAEPMKVVAPRGLADKCPALGDLIVRMLAEYPPTRGSAQQVAEELEWLLKQREPALDELWVPSTLQPPTEETWRPEAAGSSARTDLAAQLATGGCLLLVCLLGLVLMLSPGRGEGGSEGSVPVTEQPDGGTGVLGEEAMGSVHKAESPPPSGRSVSREVPTRPFDRLVRPPCAQWGAVEINGGCWRLPHKDAEKAPCYADLYEHNGRCYSPVLTSELPPTSEDP